MSHVFLLRNQQSYFFNRQGEWVSGREASSLFKALHRDEAINEVFEISARDFGQRIEVVEVATSDKGVPQIPAEWIVEPPAPAVSAEALIANEAGNSVEGESVAGEIDAGESELTADPSQPMLAHTALESTLATETTADTEMVAAETVEAAESEANQGSMDFFRVESA